MMIWGLLFSLVLGTASAARAEDPSAECTYRNLYEEHSSPLHEIPIYDQRESGLCYAYTTSQLTEFYLRKTRQWNTDAHVDPLWVAIAYKGGHTRGIRILGNQLDGGFFNTAFRDLEALGICDPAVLESSITDYKQGSKLDNPDFFLIFEMIWDLRAKRADLFPADAPNFSAILKELAKIAEFRTIRDRIDAQSRYGRDTAAQFERDMQSLVQIIAKVPAANVAKSLKIKYLRNVVLGACRGKSLLKPELPDAITMGLGWESNRVLKNGMDRMLDAPETLPVGIGYCWNIFEDDPTLRQAAERRNGIFPRILKAVIPSCGAHYSVVVGRRKALGGSCQYLIRNTYGQDFWTKRYECLCEKSPGRYENCRYDPKTSPKSDSVVGCWIDEKPLLNSLYDVSVLSRSEIDDFFHR